MALFVMIGRTAENVGAKRAEVRPRHLEHLRVLERAGRIRLAGPLLEAEGSDPVGSLVVFEADGYDVARAVVESDPYVVEGVLESYDLRAFTLVLPESRA